MGSLLAVLLGSAASLGPCSGRSNASHDAGSSAIASSAPSASAASPVIAPTPTPSAVEPTHAGAGPGLAVGDYACTHDYWVGASPYRQRKSDPTGSVTLLADGTYRWLDNGGTGRYQLDAATGNIGWLSGPIADKKPRKSTYRRNVRTSQIDITFADGFDWSCGHNL